MRRLFFWLAMGALVLVLCVELGTYSPLVRGALGLTIEDAPVSTPGLALRAHLVVDGFLALNGLSMVLAMGLGGAAGGRMHALASLVCGVLGLIGAIALLVLAIAFAMMLISLILAPPFGTIAYFAGYGAFPKGPALAALAVIMTLKLTAGGLLLASNLNHAKNRGLVLTFLLALLATIVTAFLIGLLPRPLGSILDAVAAALVAVVGIVMALRAALGGASGSVRALRLR